ncbi:hypothetical protein BsWGS_22250 [Bradybaena similaris]
MLLLLVLLSSFQTANFQRVANLAGRCDRQTAYFYGACRVRACLANETFLQGASYCDVYQAYLRTPYVRCAATLPCCAWGGVCRQECTATETRELAPTNCTTTQTQSCCVPNNASNVPRANALGQQIPALPRQNQCGNSTAVRARIVRGSVAQPTTWPWVVRLEGTQGAPGLCTGVLVDDDTVVTVAHCVARTQPNQLQVRFGRFDLNHTEPDEALVGVRNIQINPNFVSGRRGNDFAVLRLVRPVIFTQNILPVCLPDPGVALARPNQCFVSGWGVTATGQAGTQLRSAPVRFMDWNLCNVMIASASPNFTTLGTDMFCIQGSPRNNDGCIFDDGGMLSCLDVNNHYHLLGLVSEFSCGSLPTVFTRLDNHTQAILTRA